MRPFLYTNTFVLSNNATLNYLEGRITTQRTRPTIGTQNRDRRESKKLHSMMLAIFLSQICWKFCRDFPNVPRLLMIEMSPLFI